MTAAPSGVGAQVGRGDTAEEHLRRLAPHSPTARFLANREDVLGGWLDVALIDPGRVALAIVDAKGPKWARALARELLRTAEEVG